LRREPFGDKSADPRVFGQDVPLVVAIEIPIVELPLAKVAIFPRAGNGTALFFAYGGFGYGRLQALKDEWLYKRWITR